MGMVIDDTGLPMAECERCYGLGKERHSAPRYGCDALRSYLSADMRALYPDEMVPDGYAGSLVSWETRCETCRGIGRTHYPIIGDGPREMLAEQQRAWSGAYPYLMWYCRYAPTYAWVVADSLDSALEMWADYLVEQGGPFDDLEPCDDCGGSGIRVIDCEDCDGIGSINDDEHDDEDCSTCDGTGRIQDPAGEPCESCDGSGRDETDMTYTEAGWIPSEDWGVQPVQWTPEMWCELRAEAMEQHLGSEREDIIATLMAERDYLDDCDSDEDCDGCESCQVDVRLQVYPDGDWAIRTGSSDYDLDHRGYWGASSIAPSDSDEMTRALARDLIGQALDACAEDTSQPLPYDRG